MRRLLYLFLLVVIDYRLLAQIPPCGVAIVHSEGPKTYEQFVAAPPEQVKVALLKALPSVAAKVHKDEGLHIEADTDNEILGSIRQINSDAGVRGSSAGLAFGSLIIDIREATQDGAKGSMLRIKYEKPFMGAASNRGNNAQPLAEETACLAKLLSTNDPAKNPRGLALENGGIPHSVALPEGTMLKVLLRDALYSKDLNKNSAGQTIQFEVAEDAVVDGSTLVRRGALATGHFTDVTKARGYGRNAEVGFVFDTATAVDGQGIPITDEGEKAKGGRSNQTAAVALILPTLGWLVKGSDVFIPAGTIFEVESSGQHTVQIGR
jgi:hypothetical protein